MVDDVGLWFVGMKGMIMIDCYGSMVVIVVGCEFCGFFGCVL